MPLTRVATTGHGQYSNNSKAMAAKDGLVSFNSFENTRLDSLIRTLSDERV